MESKYYVYEYIRLDTNEPFYIGKGKDNRWKVKTRNKYFNNICKNIPVAVIKLHDELSEQIALEYECWYIWYYRDILGYNLVNMTDGGEGVAGYKFSKELLEYHSKTHSGKKNGFYGKKHSKENREKYSIQKSGSNNPMYGRKPKHDFNNKKALFLIKDNDVVLCFKSIKNFCEYAKNEFDKPNSGRTIMRCLKSGKDFHGFILKSERVDKIDKMDRT